MKLQTVDHVGVVVKNAEQVNQYWGKMFGIGPWTTITDSGNDPDGHKVEVKLSFAYLGDLELELIEVVSGKILHSQFLEHHGEGIHHLGFFVDDVDKESDKLVKEGAKIVLQRPGQWVYLTNDQAGGVIFELMQRRGKITSK